MNVIKYNLTVSQLYENYEHVLLKCTETQQLCTYQWFAPGWGGGGGAGNPRGI